LTQKEFKYWQAAKKTVKIRSITSAAGDENSDFNRLNSPGREHFLDENRGGEFKIKRVNNGQGKTMRLVCLEITLPALPERCKWLDPE